MRRPRNRVNSNASKAYLKDGNKNRLRAQDIHKIVDVFNRQIELPRYSRMVPVSEISSPANDYNLNIPRYIDSSEPEDQHDLDAHLNGGIPKRDIDALDAYWRVFPSVREALFRENGRPGYSEPNVETQQVRSTIFGNPEFGAFAERVRGVVEGWRQAHEPMLRSIKVDDLPNGVIQTLAEDLLARFATVPLLDRYDVYQRLMDYWADVMQDDVYLVAADGLVEAAKPRGIIDDAERKIKETPDLTIGRKKYRMDLIPPALTVARYFANEQAAIEALLEKQEAAARELEEFVEVHSGEEGLLSGALNEKDAVTRASVKDRLKELSSGASEGISEERAALVSCTELIETEAAAGKSVNEAQLALDEKVLARYAKLTEDEIKALVVADKWFASVQVAIAGEVQRLTQRLEGRVEELEDRYARPLPEAEREVEARAAKVKGHLSVMGLAWA